MEKALLIQPFPGAGRDGSKYSLDACTKSPSDGQLPEELAYSLLRLNPT
jgi:hypothetical protein